MKYIAFYDTLEYLSEKRSVAPAAANVVTYMAECFADFTRVEIISPSRTLLDRGFFPGRRSRVSDRISVVQPPTWGTRSLPGRLLVCAWTQLWLFMYLFFRLRRHEKIVVYHSLSTMTVVRWLKKIYSLELILEVREIYSDIDRDKKIKAREMAFFRLGDQYIFPTELLNKIINRDCREYVIATGLYKSAPDLSAPPPDGKIHVVYAGTLAKYKGAWLTVEVAVFLPENFRVHILGYGSPEEMVLMREKIAECGKAEAAQVSYDGVLRGEEFDKFLQRCHIGLALQDISGKFNESSFPSKILAYMADDLTVIAPAIEAIKGSPVGKYLIYYDNNSPRAIADVIMQTERKERGENRKILESLDQDLRGRLKKLFDAENAGR